MTDMVFRFPAPGPEPMTTDLDGWTKTVGTPTMKTWVQHISMDGPVISGTWTIEKPVKKHFCIKLK